MESQFHVNADCICLNTEDKKQEMEKILKTQSCARRIVIKVLKESEKEETHEGMCIQSVRPRQINYGISGE